MLLPAATPAAAAFGGRRGIGLLLLLLLGLMLARGAGAVTGAEAAAACAPMEVAAPCPPLEQQEQEHNSSSDGPPCSVGISAGAEVPGVTIARLREELVEALHQLQTAPACAQSSPAAFALRSVAGALAPIDSSAPLAAMTGADQQAWLHAVAGVAAALRSLHGQVGGGADESVVGRLVAIEEEARAAAGAGAWAFEVRQGSTKDSSRTPTYDRPHT